MVSGAGWFGLARGRTAAALAALLAAALLAGVGVTYWQLQGGSRTVTAHFSRAVGVYAGSDVRILGVKVGQILDVVPEGSTVRVVLEYDSEYQVPADARAVVVPPSVVSDRYVQLTPVYRGGDTLPDGADLPPDRSIAPLELDEIYTALDDLTKALGPDGANSTGELARLLSVGRKNLEGNGEQFGQTLRDMSQALETLSAGRKDLFGTVDNLQKFTTMLAESDQEVRRFNRQLADVSEQLAAEREELSAALRNLGVALTHVKTFVRENRKELVRNVDALTDITGALVRQRQALIDVMDVGPTGLQNLALSYNAKSGTTDTRNNKMGPYDAASWVCSLMVHVLPAEEIPKECFELAKRLHEGDGKLTPELAKLLGLSLPQAGRDKKDGGGIDSPLPSGEIGSSDPTFGGILGDS